MISGCSSLVKAPLAKMLNAKLFLMAELRYIVYKTTIKTTERYTERQKVAMRDKTTTK